MTWRGVFIDGPLAGPDHDRMFMGSWQSELYLMPMDDVGDGWVLVGTDHIPPDVAWPGQVHYVRNDDRSQLLSDIPAGEDEGWAIFEVAP